MAGPPPLPGPATGLALVKALAPKYGLDPGAVLRVAGVEGGGGGIGDQGTSFGPFQLHYGGAYPSSAPQGASASQAWAWSPAGINYALSRMSAAGARGLTGGNAVNTIVRNFERPANPDAEVARALGLSYVPSSGGPSGGVSGGYGDALLGANAGGLDPRRAFVQGLSQAMLLPNGPARNNAMMQNLMNLRGMGTGLPTILNQAAWGTPKPRPGRPGIGQSGLPPLKPKPPSGPPKGPKA